MANDIGETVDEMLAKWMALRAELAPQSKTADGMPCCCVCGTQSGIVAVASGVFGCRDCLGDQQ